MFLLSARVALDSMPGVADFGCMPLIFTRWVNDKSFLAEYERRLDRVVDHDVHKKYTVGSKLGSGVTASVYRATEKESGTEFALKRIPLRKSASLKRAVDREMKTLKKLRHKNITALHEHFASPNYVWAVIEMVSGV